MDREAPVTKTALWRKALPFVIAVILLAYVISRLDLRFFLVSLAHVNPFLFLLFTAAIVLSVLLADTVATVVIYRRVVGPIASRDFFILRGASYLPSLINHHVGQAFVTYFVSKAYSTSLWRVAGATLIGYASWTGCLLATASLALWLAGLPSLWLAIPLGAGLIYLAILALRPAMLRRVPLLSPLFDMGVLGHLIALLARVPHLTSLFLGTWISFLFFGVHIPLRDAVAYVPILLVVVTLPITPQGFGTRDVVAMTLLERFAAGPTHEAKISSIVAATTSWGIASTLGEAALGLWLMRGALPKVLGKVEPR